MKAIAAVGVARGLKKFGGYLLTNRKSSHSMIGAYEDHNIFGNHDPSPGERVARSKEILRELDENQYGWVGYLKKLVQNEPIDGNMVFYSRSRKEMELLFEFLYINRGVIVFDTSKRRCGFQMDFDGELLHRDVWYLRTFVQYGWFNDFSFGKNVVIHSILQRSLELILFQANPLRTLTISSPLKTYVKLIDLLHQSTDKKITRRFEYGNYGGDMIRGLFKKVAIDSLMKYVGTTDETYILNKCTSAKILSLVKKIIASLDKYTDTAYAVFKNSIDEMKKLDEILSGNITNAVEIETRRQKRELDSNIGSQSKIVFIIKMDPNESKGYDFAKIYQAFDLCTHATFRYNAKYSRWKPNVHLRIFNSSFDFTDGDSYNQATRYMLQINSRASYSQSDFSRYDYSSVYRY